MQNLTGRSQGWKSSSTPILIDLDSREGTLLVCEKITQWLREAYDDDQDENEQCEKEGKALRRPLKKIKKDMQEF